MGSIIAFLTAFFGAPKAIEALLARVDVLEAKISGYQKEKESARIDQATKSSTNAQTSEDVKKAAHEAADVTKHL